MSDTCIRRISHAVLAIGLITAGAASYGQDRYQIIRDIEMATTSISRDVYSTNASDNNLLEAKELVLRARQLILSQSPGDSRLICEPYSSGYAYVVRTFDRQRIGNYTSLAACNDIVRSSYNGMVCAPYTSNLAYITHISNLSRVGNYTDLPNCMAMIRQSTRQLVCEPYTGDYAYIHRLSDQTRLGNYTASATCRRALQSSNNRFVCAPYSGDYAYITEIATGNRLGNYLPFEQCFRNIPPYFE